MLMPTFEIDIRGGQGSNLRERLEECGVPVGLLPGGVAIGIIDADTAEEAEPRVYSILDAVTDGVTVRQGDGRRQAGPDKPPAHEKPPGDRVA
jgi:hypothetical protein